MTYDLTSQNSRSEIKLSFTDSLFFTALHVMMFGDYFILHIDTFQKEKYKKYDINVIRVLLYLIISTVDISITLITVQNWCYN